MNRGMDRDRRETVRKRTMRTDREERERERNTDRGTVEIGGTEKNARQMGKYTEGKRKMRTESEETDREIRTETLIMFGREKYEQRER